MKKRIYYFYIILIFPISFINQERIAFAETVNTPTNEYLNQKKDKRCIEAKDSEIYAGDLWNPEDNFVSATDEDGNPIYWGDLNIDVNTMDFDPNIAGSYSILYFFKYTNIRTLVYIQVKSSIEAKDSEIYAGERWDPKENFVSATDEDGNPVYWGDSRITWTGTVDVSKPGINEIEYRITRNGNVIRSKVKVKVKENKSSIKTKDSQKYVGERWNPEENFVSATDEDGNPVYWGDSRITWTGTVDVSKPGINEIEYRITRNGNVIRSKVKVKVKEDKSSIKTKDSEKYVGERWNPEENFVSATDEDGNPVYWGDSCITWTGTVDVSKPGINEIGYRITSNGNVIRSKVKVKVKEDKSSIKTKDSEKYVGERWDPKENFVSATDEDGHSVPWEDPRIIKNGASIDTSKPGIHKMKYTHRGKVKDIDSEFTVTVKEEPFTIKQVPYFDFEDHILVSTNKSVVNKKENPMIEVETPSIEGKDWQLQVELSPFLDKANDKSILKGVSLFIPKGKLESDLETEEPTQYDCQLEANGKASILMHGTKTKGKGRWKNKLATKEIILSIPPENKKGNYESTLHWTLLDVPG
ncbi:bacterial Ig-like domain-containing protein [Enterococcus faecalis]|uniref:bacterial Ig-like domain-containing protein n=3 Tax=Enterococcus faecalis TaxID=1351 RepID=UPI0015A2A563|nr:bacterial Ig-like domain-containing protein [Enterococcus faecalis]NVX16976.1 bacterial Ig-like domain-containing protein [Enterococcus faecalis]